MALIDDLGSELCLSATPTRVVSLVPSITEALATSARDALVGATDWCSHPTDLDVTRVRGTKNPDLAAVADLRPDLVVANREENREIDVRRLRERGIPVWVTVTESVPQALDSLERLFTGPLDRRLPPWLGDSRRLWGNDVPAPVRTVAVPIWRDPWMVIGARTFAGDVLARLGLANVFADHEDRYPHMSVADIVDRRPDVVLLPDEPYEFSPDDGPEAFDGIETELVSGRLLTWYGPSLVEAHRVLSGLV